MALKTEIIAQQSVRERPQNTPPSSEVTATQVGLALATFSVAVLIVTLILIFVEHFKNKKSLYPHLDIGKSFSSIPCRKCQFFDNNQHLACAVQPALVLSLEASKCQDYRRRKK
ncbi:MAG: hypothetical protein KI793_09645 [Rivularia sp. (in: Bacteria)]|nr:hypothetical protein [Rivularia sp. MS3]